MIRVLVIEDETYLLEEIVSMLTFEGFEAYGAPNGYIGIQEARQRRPDLILCDIMMPGLDGYHVLLELRNDVRTATIPFIFLTAKTERADLRKGMEYGADDYLTKPFTVNELLSSINARLEKKRALTQQYEQQIQDLRQALDSSIPHEMRTPLTLMMGYADLLIQDFDSVEPERLLMMAFSIKKAGVRLQRLIENYLLYTQLEIVGLPEERVQLLRNHVLKCTSAVAVEVIADKAREQEREADLIMQIDSIQLFLSESDFRKIVDELIDNAFKFSTAGSAVSVSLAQEDGWTILAISDQGRGMSEEQVSSVGAYLQFERKQYEQQGLGLGLTVARRLVELYGGHLVIESQPTQGTTVRVALPVQR